MPSGLIALIRKYSFAAVVAAVVGLMAVVIVVKSVLPDGEGAAMASAKAPGPAAKGKGGGEAVLVQTAAVQTRTFSDAIQALGTAQARESIVITPKVSDTIRALRFESGQRVQRGQVLVELTSVEQQADLAEAVADNAAAQENLRRFQTLFDRGFAPRAQLDAARASADAAQARVDAGRSRMSDRVMRAPFSGVMGLRLASPGQLVAPGDQIGTLDDLSEIKLDFDVPEAQLARVQPGVPIAARTAAFADASFDGRIAQVDSRVSPQTRTMRVRALLPNPGERLRPGMLMTVEIRSNPRQALAAPEPAVVDDAAGPYVYIAATGDHGLTAQKRLVHIGQRVDGFVEITDGLAEGDQVIVEGVQRVRPDAPVRLGAPSDGLRGSEPRGADTAAKTG